VIFKMAKREIENLNSLLEEIRAEDLFLAVVKDGYPYPQLVVSSTYPTTEGAISFCFFIFPYIITKIDDGNKIYSPKGIFETTVYPYKGKITGIFKSLLENKTSSFDRNIEKLKALKEIENILN